MQGLTFSPPIISNADFSSPFFLFHLKGLGAGAKRCYDASALGGYPRAPFFHPISLVVSLFLLFFPLFPLSPSFSLFFPPFPSFSFLFPFPTLIFLPPFFPHPLCPLFGSLTPGLFPYSINK